MFDAYGGDCKLDSLWYEGGFEGRDLIMSGIKFKIKQKNLKFPLKLCNHLNHQILSISDVLAVIAIKES
jgi:hypothetical protein